MEVVGGVKRCRSGAAKSRADLGCLLEAAAKHQAKIGCCVNMRSKLIRCAVASLADQPVADLHRAEHLSVKLSEVQPLHCRAGYLAGLLGAI